MARRLVVALLLGLCSLMVLPALADAHIVTGVTVLTRHRTPSGPIDAGDKLIIYGRLKSIAAECSGGQTVTLMRKQPGTDRSLRSDVTDVEGEYFFERRPRRDQEVYVLYKGYTLVDPSHVHTCIGTDVRPITLNVIK